MRTYKITGMAILLLFSCLNAFSQDSLFVSPDGFKWNMSQQEVRKIKVDEPSTVNADKIVYSDIAIRCVTTFYFENDKLFKIEEFHGLDKKGYKKFYGTSKKQFIELYGSDFGTAPGRGKNLNRLEWNKYESTIVIENVMGESIGIIYKRGLF
jgi:hypothetical protein